MRARSNSTIAVCRVIAALVAFASSAAVAHASLPASIFAPHSTPAHQEHQLALFVLGISALIFLGVSILLTYAIVKFRARPNDDTEPPQVFGSLQIELSWTIIPILIIVVLFLGTARVLFSVQDAKKPANALDVVVIGHQFWWEFRYPKYNVVAANEMHVPVSSVFVPRPTFMKLTSADVMHSFWVPQLNGKTDLLPNRVNEMWIDPRDAGGLRGPVRAVLRSAARQDAAAGLCRFGGRFRQVDQEPAAHAGRACGAACSDGFDGECGQREAPMRSTRAMDRLFSSSRHASTAIRWRAPWRTGVMGLTSRT